MRGLVASAGVAAAIAGFGFTSGYADTQAWTDYPGKVCDGYNILPYAHPDPDVSSASCYAKCAALATAKTAAEIAAANAACAIGATQDSAQMCLSLSDCGDLCWSLDECQSYDMDPAAGVCYLNTWDCASVITSGGLTTAAGYTLYAKQVPWQAECGGDMSVDVAGGDYGVDNSYTPSLTDPTVFTRKDGLFRLKWEGCDWRLQKSVEAEVDPASACADDVDGANFLFGLTTAVPADKTAQGYDPHICARGKVAGYCSGALFEGVCAATCGLAELSTCWGDNDAAAAVLADAWAVEAKGCDLCAVTTETGATVGSYDPVVQSICKTTCGAARFPDAALYAPDAGDIRRLTTYAQLEAHGRKLQGIDTWADYFWTTYPDEWSANGGEPACAMAMTRDLSLLTDMTICDAFRFENPVPGLTMMEVCPKAVLYTTTEAKYCPFQNVMQNTVQEHRCVVKCKPGAPMDPDCAGTDSLLLPDSDALCLPRDECEALCTSLKDCISIDMHKALPRCYLNAACDAGLVVEDTNYQLLTKSMLSFGYLTTPSKYCPATNVDPRATPLMEHQCLAKCNTATPCEGDTCFCDGAFMLDPTLESSQFALCLPRPQCEAVCSATKGCVSFDMHKTLPRCYLNMVGPDMCTLEDDVMYEIATKTAAGGCYPKIIRNPTPADDAYGLILEGFAGEYPIKVGDTYSKVGSDVVVSWSGCEWRVEKPAPPHPASPSWSFSSVVRSDAGYPTCAVTTPMSTATLTTDLFYSKCPTRIGMSTALVCEGQTTCPVLTRCIVSEVRMTAELAGRPGGKPATLASSTECEAYTSNPQAFVSRQLASPSRAEYSIDMGMYGPILTPDADFRGLSEMIYRSAPMAPLSVVTLVHKSVRALNVISSSVGDSMLNLGATYAVPTGYSMFISDFVRVETFADGCKEPDDVPQVVTVGFKLPPGTVMASAFVLEELPAPAPSTMTGDYIYVSIPKSSGMATTLAVAADMDECMMMPCSADATCTNTIGSFTCVCNEGFEGDGFSCEPVVYMCPPLTFRVANGDALDFGWRVREMELFTDDKCTDPVSLGFSDMTIYSASTNAGCTDTPSPTYSNALEIVATNNCYMKCGSGMTLRQRRLTRGRRMQISGSDWNNCDGYDPAQDMTSSTAAICVSQPTCGQICNQLGSACGAYSMAADSRCFIYPACTTTAVAGSTAYVKSNDFSIQSSKTFEGHPNSLLVDGFGKDDKKDDAPTFTEWWSDCFSCAKEEAWFEVSIAIPASIQCKIEGMKVWQDPNNAAQTLNVAEGPRDRPSLPAEKGVRPDYARQLPDMTEKWTETWSFMAGQDMCLPLKCGMPDTFLDGTIVATLPDVQAACNCKQYCIDYMDRGCTAWRHRVESDSNFDATKNVHTHMVCELLKDTAPVPASDPFYTSGYIDTVVQEFAPITAVPSVPFTLSVTGIMLPEAALKQRVKLVAAADGCSAAPPETVSGIGCSDPAICSPRPSSYTSSSAMWSSVTVASAKESMEYSICYCPGPCYADWQYVPVPGGTLFVKATELYFTPEPAELTRATGKFDLKVECPAFSCLRANGVPRQDPETWRVKLVERSAGTCFATETSLISDTGSWSKGADLLYSATWEFSIDPSVDSAGTYLVCFCEVDEGTAQGAVAPCSAASDWTPIASEGTNFLTVTLLDEDLEPPSGFFRGLRFSAMVGQSTMVTVGGRNIDNEHSLLVASDCSNGGDAFYPTSASSSELTYEIVAPDTAGIYEVCIVNVTQGENNTNVSIALEGVFVHENMLTVVGTLAVTSRVDLGWTYIFDPNVAGSIEISGRTLDWQKDRMMIADCSATCGYASAVKSAVLSGSPSNLKVVNSFVALNNLLDLEYNETTSLSEPLPTSSMKFVRVQSAYCKGNNLAEADVKSSVWANSCYSKCKDCSGPSCKAECAGYSPNVDGPDSQALCVPEEECRDLCTSTQTCFGIDMYKYGPRCYLNIEGSPANGCKKQYESSGLGVSAAYDFLAKDKSAGTKTITIPEAISSADVLRFAPVAFSRSASGAGKYKVCFCDSALLSGASCLSEADYTLEVGELYVSGVSCLLADTKYRRGTCYPMYHGGLACSETHTLPTITSLPASAGLPTSWSDFM
jgi:hypothetical protein